jgi:hypothetical protein
VYIKGGFATNLTVFAHELGHTQGLSHSGRSYGSWIDYYGDYSDVMGDVKAVGYLCTNAPNMFRVGWSGPAFHLRPQDINNAPSYTIPATSASDANYIALNMSVPGVPMPSYFLSLRSRTPTYDSILGSAFNDKVGGGPLGAERMQRPAPSATRSRTPPVPSRLQGMPVARPPPPAREVTGCR